MKRFFVLVLALLLAALPVALSEDPGNAPEKPIPLGITLKEFVDAYNALPGLDRPIGQQQDLEDQVVGVVYLPVSELLDVYVQLGYDQRQDAVQFVGCVMYPDELGWTDFEGFLSVTLRLMAVVFPDLDEPGRQQMLLSAIDEGVRQGKFGENGGNVTYRQGKDEIRYIVNEDGGRQIVIYQQG